MRKSLAPLLLSTLLVFNACSESSSKSTSVEELNKESIFEDFGVGFGGGSSFKFHNDIWLNSSDLILNTISDNSEYTKITNYNSSKFEQLAQQTSKSKYLVMWLVKGWQENWFSIEELQRVVDADKILVFNYWYFGDELMNGLPADLSEYRADVKRFKSLLDKIDGTKLIILEPEFNKENILADPKEFIDVMSEAIDTLKDDSTYISLCMTDTGNRSVDQTYEKCGYENCSLGDKYEWSQPKEIYDALLDKLDFISFQEMVGSFSRDPQDPGTWENPNAKNYTDREIGIDFLPTRIDNFAKYLKETYNKPVFLPYITIATATWSDNNTNGVIDSGEVDESGWETQASDVYRRLESESLFGYAVMELFDDPLHDAGGYQFFMDNEYHIGVVKSDILENQLSGNIEFKGDILDSIFKDR